MSALVLAERSTFKTFSIEPLGPFLLLEAARFWNRFTPASHAGLDAEGHLHMAFPVEGTWQTIGVCVQDRGGEIAGRVYGDVELSVALRRLQTLPGTGPFSGELILLRGAGHPDYLTLLEPRFRRAATDAYGLDHLASDADLRRISDAWRPYRMWLTFLLRQSADAHGA